MIGNADDFLHPADSLHPASSVHPVNSMINVRIAVIVAIASNGVIGHENRIPWHLSEDLKYFKATTMGHTIIMGRKTFESIGRPLPGRRTIVVSRSPSWSAPGVSNAQSLNQAILLAQAAEPIFIAGGADIYREALPIAARLLVTEVDLNPPGDVFFPVIDPKVWRRTAGPRQRSSSGIDFTFVTYDRV